MKRSGAGMAGGGRPPPTAISGSGIMERVLGVKVMRAMVAMAGLMAACGYDNKGGYSGPNPPVNAQEVTASGDLTAALTQFRGLLGDSANRVVGQQAGGRREVNWDGVGGAILNVNTFPGDQFNRVVPRGQVLTTPGTGLRVSDEAF